MCGKTSILHSLLLSKHGLKLQHLHVFSTTLYQPVYEILKRAIEENRINGINQYFHGYSNEDDVISVEDAPPHSIMVFDDIASEKTNKMADYYCRGRHKNIDSFYLCQTYFKIPKQLIRNNANLIILFKQDVTNMKHIYNEHVSSDLTYKEFNDVCNLCWDKTYGYLVINKTRDKNNGRYKNTLNNIITFD